VFTLNALSWPDSEASRQTGFQGLPPVIWTSFATMSIEAAWFGLVLLDLDLDLDLIL
jgi:hypothetical protein